MDEQPQHLVRDLLTSAVAEFFQSHGLECSAVQDTGEASTSALTELGSIIGFRGKTIRGGLAFVAPIDLIAELLPVPKDREHGDVQLRDWSAEIANQLVGRLKNKLSARSVNFDIGTAVCFTGKSIRLVFLPDAEGLSLTFQAGDAPVRIHLDCSISSEITGGDVEDLRIVPEGDVLLF